jgi:hypothetical protein
MSWLLEFRLLEFRLLEFRLCRAECSASLRLFYFSVTAMRKNTNLKECGSQTAGRGVELNLLRFKNASPHVSPGGATVNIQGDQPTGRCPPLAIHCRPYRGYC